MKGPFKTRSLAESSSLFQSRSNFHMAEESARLYVGRLSYSTTAENLGKLFEKEGDVKEAVITAFNGRSRGYGFVTMSSPEIARAAQQALDGAELDGRKIVVEFARPQGPRNGPTRGGFRGRGRGGRGRGRGGRGRGFFPGFRNNFMGGYYPYPPYAGYPPYGAPFPGRRFFGRGRGRGGRGGRGYGRRPRPSRFNPNAPILPTRIHVKNIPYNFTDDKLAEAFQGYNVTEARIIRSLNGRSHGYGFISLADHESQERLLNEHPTIDIQGRKAVLSPAREPNPRPQQPTQN